jgi:outer membrane receptor protein involved in Fe transport
MKHGIGMRRLLGALVLTAGAAAHAQEPAQEPDVIPVAEEAPPPADVTELPDIVVTSNKKEQVLRDIPASIAAVDGAGLEASGAQGLEDFLKLVPGVNLIPNEPGAVKVTIRGISSELGTNATTGIMFGNVSFNDAYFPFVSLDPNPFDLYGVEVMKGPQGTLYGAGALNGAVRYVPNRPEFETFETKYFAQYARVEEGGGGPIYGAAVNVPVGSDLALRIVGHERRSPGYVDDVGRGLEDVNEVDQYSLRGMAEWQPAARWGVSLTYLRQDTTFADDAFADNRDGNLTRDNTPSPNRKTSFYDLWNAAVQYDFDAWSLTFEGAQVGKRFAEAPDISRLANGEANESTVATTIFFNSDTRTLELRAASAAGGESPWSWVGGAFWSDQPIDSGFDIFTADGAPAGTPVPVGGLSGLGGGAPLGLVLVTTDGQAVLGHQRTDVTVTEQALFADLTRTAWQDWEFSLGLRGYRTTSGGVTRTSGPLYGGAENENRGEVDEDGINPKASVRWRASDRVQAYTLVSQGFRVGGIQPTASGLSSSIPRSFKSDTIWNYEAGVRTQWLGDTLRADLTGFHEKWNEPQLAQRDPNNPNPVATYYDNVGGARSDGAELAVLWRTPVDGLSATLAAAYARTVTTVPFTTAAGVATEPGTSWPYAPRWQTATTVAYDQPLWGAWQLHGALTHTLMSKAYTTLANTTTVFDYDQLDALLRLGEASGRWPDLSIGASNLLDERGINQHVLTGEADDIIYIRPRTLFLRIDGRF